MVLVTPPCRVQFVSWQDILLLRVPLCGYKCDFASLSPARHRKLSQQYTSPPQISVHSPPKKVIEFCGGLSQFVLVRVLWTKIWLTAIVFCLVLVVPFIPQHVQMELNWDYKKEYLLY